MTEKAKATPTYKDNLADIKDGDFVVLRAAKGTGYSLVPVLRTTVQHILVGAQKFRRDGREVGGDKWWASDIYAPLARIYASSPQTYLDAVRIQNEQIKSERQACIDFIRKADLESMDSKVLELAAKLLGRTTISGAKSS